MATVYFGLGSNVEREKHIVSGMIELAEHFDWQQRSRVFESEAVGFAGSSFYNLVVKVKTDCPIPEVVQRCKQIERDHGRSEHSPKFSPRTLDIDILLYDNVVNERDPQLPRAEILHNAFVLWPLAEIAPNKQHPICQTTYLQLWQQLKQSTDQQLVPIADERWLPF